MAYFSHAFQKLFLGTGIDLAAASIDGVTISTDNGFLSVNSAPVPTYFLNVMSDYAAANGGTDQTKHYFGIFNAKGASKDLSNVAPSSCCSVYIAGSAIYSNDKIGPFHGGYQETNKSKEINPRYVSKFYRVDACTPQNEVVHVGSTYYTAGGGVLATDSLVGGTGYTTGTVTTVTGGSGTGMIVSITAALGVVTAVTIINPGKGYVVGETLTIDGGNDDATIDVLTVSIAPETEGECCKEFLCGETYNLLLNVKGSPALRYLDRNAYYTAEFYTGCCADDTIAPTAVDSTLVMIGWANLLIASPIVNPFFQIVIQDEAGVLWYAPGTSATFLASVGGDTWDNYVSPGHTEDACAGMIFNGAYVDTKFGNCTFQISDFYEKEPVKLYPAEVDLNGDPCAFEGLCVAKECEGRQVMGLGETVLRDLILSESYRQNFLHTDLRVREITQGDQMISAINRSSLYTKYYLLHNVPRFNNPSSVFDNDQYLLEIVTAESSEAFEDAINDWLEGCNTECVFEEFTCVTDCDVPLTFPSSTVTPSYPSRA